MELLNIFEKSTSIKYYSNSKKLSFQMLFDTVKQYNNGITLSYANDFGTGVNVLTIRNVADVNFKIETTDDKTYIRLEGIDGFFELNS